MAVDAEDFDSIEEYWEMLCDHQDLCAKCYAPWSEHDEFAEEGLGCPE